MTTETFWEANTADSLGDAICGNKQTSPVLTRGPQWGRCAISRLWVGALDDEVEFDLTIPLADYAMLHFWASFGGSLRREVVHDFLCDRQKRSSLK